MASTLLFEATINQHVAYLKPYPSRAEVGFLRRVFDMVATDRLLVTGMHLHFPGFTHLVRQGTGYRLIPTAWEQAI